MRALGLDDASRGRESLDAIAAVFGVSRETVRRARGQLAHSIRLYTEPTIGGPPLFTALLPNEAPTNSPATARALRRVLTMTGPLRWDELLSAWARAGGKPPFSPLPTDSESTKTWADRMGGFVITQSTTRAPIQIDVLRPEPLDQVSAYLYELLREHSGGVDRAVLIESAKRASLKPTTIATALSSHPAVKRIGRSTWTLRGRPSQHETTSHSTLSTRSEPRGRPTTFSWNIDGSLTIEFSVPRGPSPVVAIPRAIADLLEERAFRLHGSERPAQVTVRGARLWGFGPLVSERGLSAGARAILTLNLVAGTARFEAAGERGTPR